MPHYLGIEIGGTKLQLALGQGNGKLDALWRGHVQPSDGAEGIRRQLQQAVPQLLAEAGLTARSLFGCGIGFGGPVDDRTRTILKSHQIDGWENFPLADWISDQIGVPTVLGNDADVAGLGEALHGAGQGLSPIFYITIGSGIGGGLILDGKIYRGTGKGAAEIGHLIVSGPKEDSAWWELYPEDYPQWALDTIENFASGWALERRLRKAARWQPARCERLLAQVEGDADRLTLQHAAVAARQGDALSRSLFTILVTTLANGINRVITLLCPRRVVIGGGVALLGEDLLFAPLRAALQAEPQDSLQPWERPFAPFLGETDLAPALLGEEMVLHGAIALARQALPG